MINFFVRLYILSKYEYRIWKIQSYINVEYQMSLYSTSQSSRTGAQNYDSNMLLPMEQCTYSSLSHAKMQSVAYLKGTGDNNIANMPGHQEHGNIAYSGLLIISGWTIHSFHFGHIFGNLKSSVASEIWGCSLVLSASTTIRIASTNCTFSCN